MYLRARDSAIQDRAAWLAPLFLLAGVLTPTVCVLWFMSEAARTQADFARQSITDAYRGQLWIMRDRVDANWAARAAVLQRMSGVRAAPEFLQAVTRDVADSVIFLDPGGAVAYPSPASLTPAQPVADRKNWLAAEALERKRDQVAAAAEAYGRLADAESDPALAARAAQAQIRCLVESGERDIAIQEIQKHFSAVHTSRGAGPAGASIAANEQLLALHLMKPGDDRRQPVARHLAALVNDYDGVRMPSAQRLFLMDEMRALWSGPERPAFPSYAAEVLAAQFLTVESPSPGDRTLQKTRLPGVWKFASPDGRVIALYRSETIVAAMRGVLEGLTARRSVKFAMIPPGQPDKGEAIAAGPALPGWRIAFSLLDTQAFDEAARGRMVSYLWAGFLAVAAMVVTGVLVGRWLGRQRRLARLKTDLVAAVSHELKTPLASMRLLVDALLEDKELDPRKTRDYLELIAGENQRLSRLIENFLTFSRIERNRQRFEFGEARPEEVVRKAVRAMHERLQPPACHLEMDIGPDLPPLHADEDALVTALLNLLDNAWKYTPANRRISLRAYPDDGRVVFAVKDNGIGIAARERKRIFRRFYQVDRRLAREAGGCGLGLSIVESIVRAHGGSVSVESEPGTGSTFRLMLPAGEGTNGQTHERSVHSDC
jgi:signal transduction histidine kinase